MSFELENVIKKVFKGIDLITSANDLKSISKEDQ